MVIPEQEDPVFIKHTGQFSYHDDDCRCSEFDKYCNRDGRVWSCCGSCKENSDCSGSVTHPTYWNHPQVSKTRTGEYIHNRPVYKTNKEIRELFPGIFQI